MQTDYKYYLIFGIVAFLASFYCLYVWYNRPVVLYARDFGAVGDGIADDRQAIQRAFDALPKEGGFIEFDSCTYNVDGPIFLPVTMRTTVNGNGCEFKVTKESHLFNDQKANEVRYSRLTLTIKD